MIRIYLVSQTAKILLAMQEIWVQSLGGEGPMEEGMAIHSSILAWRTPWTEEPGGLRSMGSQRAGHDFVTKQQQQKRRTGPRDEGRTPATASLSMPATNMGHDDR